MTKKLIFIFTLIFLSPAQGEWKFSGQAGPYINSLEIPSTTVTQSDKSGLYSELKLDKKINSTWRLKSDTVIRTDFVARDSVEFFQWIPRNFYLQKKAKTLTMRIGFQTLTIDGPDVVNPAAIIHAKNWIDPTSPLTMSSAGLLLSQEISEWTWDLFYVPRQTPAVLPGEHSPWLPRKKRLPIESEDSEIRIPDNVRYQYLGATELNDSLSHNVTAKVQRKSEKLETQFIYYNGLSHSPFLLTRVTGTLISVNPDLILVDSPVRLKPLYYRHEALAGTFNIPFESWAIRGGMNWLKPIGHDPRVPKETTLLTAGFEKSFETPIGLVTGIADYVRQKRQDDNQISFLRSILEEAVTYGARIPWGEETQFFAGGLYDLVGESSLYNFTATHRLSNSWSIEGGAQFVKGPDDTLLGLYEKYDSYRLNLSYFW
jgi:hypothetical protein